MMGFGNFEFGSALQREKVETDLSHLETFKFRVKWSECVSPSHFNRNSELNILRPG